MVNFLNRTQKKNRKPPTISEFGELIARGELGIPPVRFEAAVSTATRRGTSAGKDNNGSWDGVLIARWRDQTRRFVCEYKALGTPKGLEIAVSLAQQKARGTGSKPLIIVPYLSEDKLSRLANSGVSGIDLCGNGVLLSPGFYIWRSGRPNQFKSSQPIKNVFRGRSSLIVRTLLLQPRFESLTLLRGEVTARLVLRTPFSDRGGVPPQVSEFLGEDDPTRTRLEDSPSQTVTLSTVSKVVQSLEEELLVTTEGGGVRLLDPGRLLEELRVNVRPPVPSGQIQGKMEYEPLEVFGRLEDVRLPNGRDFFFAATGMGSVSRYTAMAVPQKLSLYVTDLSAAMTVLEISETVAFPNAEIIETNDETVYFDRRSGPTGREWPADEGTWASPIQTYLELSRGTSRDQDAAEQLGRSLIAQIEEEAPWIRT